MTEREGAPLSFCRILAPTNAPHDSKILYYLNDRNEGHYYFCRILVPPPPNALPLPLTPQYLITILMTEGVGNTFCRILAPPPSHDTTILNYLNDREMGRHYRL